MTAKIGRINAICCGASLSRATNLRRTSNKGIRVYVNTLDIPEKDNEEDTIKHITLKSGKIITIAIRKDW